MTETNRFQAGAAMASIMPTPEIIDNKWHPQMAVRFDELGSPLFVKVLALSFDDRCEVLLVNLDTINIPRTSGDSLRRAIAGSTGVQHEDVTISCTHSHSTPFVEDLRREHPYFDHVAAAAQSAADQAWAARQPARFGHGRAHIVGASFNQRVPLPDGGVKFTRDYREGLASGRPVDPRLSVVRIDDEAGKPIAGWVRFAAHPACVIFDAPISAEYPGYMTQQLSDTVAGGAPMLFGFGAAGDVNCVPMFGSEKDSARLGKNLAEQAGPVFEAIQTRPPQRLVSGHETLPLPLDDPPSIETLDRELAELEAFHNGLDEDPNLMWVLGFNCWKDWSVEKKKAYVVPLIEWIQRMKTAHDEGSTFPCTWPVPISAWVIDDLGLLFYAGEPFTEIGLAIAARSPLKETLVLSHCNGLTGYLGTDEDRRRGGYETALWNRCFPADLEIRTLPYALGAADAMIDGTLALLDRLHRG
jgi:hypothetical protein